MHCIYQVGLWTCGRVFSWFLIDVGEGAQLSLGDTILWQMCLGSQLKVTAEILERQPVRSFPPLTLLQFLPLGSCSEFLS